MNHHGIKEDHKQPAFDPEAGNDGISSVEALLDYYPFRYEVMQETPVAQWNINDTITCEGTILRRGTLLRLANHRTMTRFSILCQSQEFQVTLFNRPLGLAVSAGKNHHADRQIQWKKPDHGFTILSKAFGRVGRDPSCL